MIPYPKIDDNQMNYFKNKAQQIILLKKEDHEWEDFCKKIAPECAACVAEKRDSKVSKDIGIQAFPGKTFNKIERITPELKYRNEQIPDALNSIKTRLEKIDVALSKIYDLPQENNKEKKFENDTLLHKEKTLKSLEDERKHFIQNSLRASLQKIQTSYPRIAKPPTTRMKNPGYVLPHDLQVKRAAARKAYLASLQTKPKVLFKNIKKNIKNVQGSQKKKSLSKDTSKINTKKKDGLKKTKDLIVDEAETLMTSETEEPKDENIEHIVDTILEDLMGEAALDFNKIKLGKKHAESTASNDETYTNKTKNMPALLGLLHSTPTRNTLPKAQATVDNNGIKKLKLFFNSLDEDKHKSEISEKNVFNKNKSTFPTEDPENLDDDFAATKQNTDILHKQISIVKNPPKFVCDVLNVITVNQEKAKNILDHKEMFLRYLKSISRRVKGNFNPWVLNEMLAESILDDCIKEIAEELSEMPSNFIKDLYNQEFVQQVGD